MRFTSTVALRRPLIVLWGVLCLGLTAVEAHAKTVKDPNHVGYTGKYPKLKQVQWQAVEAKCKSCIQITAQYNQTVQQLLNHRYWVKFWREVQKAREKGKGDPFWPGAKDADITDFESKVVAANLELFELQKAQLDLHRKTIATLEQQASFLAKAMLDCERTACQVKRPTKLKPIKIGGEAIKVPFQPDVPGILKQHDIDWQGAYTTDCAPCRSIVAQLNALPGWVTRAHMKLQNAERQLKYSELIKKSNKVKLDFLEYSHPDKTDYSHLPAEVEKLKAELAAYKRLFEKLVVDLATCEAKFCPKSDDEKVSMCPEPAAHDAILVGANDEVGSSADFKQKAKQKAKGAATKALSGLLGLGSGSGGGAEGPATYDDPIRNKYKQEFENKQDKRELKVGGMFTSDGLLISTDIEKAPGKGTFQTAYLENPRGWRLSPIALYLYEIWKNWKLSVSWTRDTYVDGEHVLHEEGGWTESWSELYARGEIIEYGLVETDPLWIQLGFNTAVSGARSLGTLFPISPEMLNNEPINLVIHITDPDKDPVVTVPYVFELKPGKKDTVEFQQVPQTIAAASGPCT